MTLSPAPDQPREPYRTPIIALGSAAARIRIGAVEVENLTGPESQLCCLTIRPIADLTELPVIRDLSDNGRRMLCGACDPSKAVVGKADLLGLRPDTATVQALAALTSPDYSPGAKREALLALARQCPPSADLKSAATNPFALLTRKEARLHSPEPESDEPEISVVLPGGLPVDWINGEFGALFDVVPPSPTAAAKLRIVYRRDADGEEKGFIRLLVPGNQGYEVTVGELWGTIPDVRFAIETVIGQLQAGNFDDLAQEIRGTSPRFAYDAKGPDLDLYKLTSWFDDELYLPRVRVALGDEIAPGKRSFQTSILRTNQGDKRFVNIELVQIVSESAPHLPKTTNTVQIRIPERQFSGDLEDTDSVFADLETRPWLILEIPGIHLHTAFDGPAPGSVMERLDLAMRKSPCNVTHSPACVSFPQQLPFATYLSDFIRTGADYGYLTASKDHRANEWQLLSIRACGEDPLRITAVSGLGHQLAMEFEIPSGEDRSGFFESLGGALSAFHDSPVKSVARLVGISSYDGDAAPPEVPAQNSAVCHAISDLLETTGSLWRREPSMDPLIIPRHCLEWRSPSSATIWAPTARSRWLRLVVGPEGCQEFELTSLSQGILPGFRVVARAKNGSLYPELIRDLTVIAAKHPDPFPHIRSIARKSGAPISSGWYWGGRVKQIDQINRLPWWSRP